MQTRPALGELGLEGGDGGVEWWDWVEGDCNQGSYGYCIRLCVTRARSLSSHAGSILDIAIVNIAQHDALPPRYTSVGPASEMVESGESRYSVRLRWCTGMNTI